MRLYMRMQYTFRRGLRGFFALFLSWGTTLWLGPAGALRAQEDNLALGAPVTCSTASAGRCSEATDGDLANTTHTVEGDSAPWLEIDLLAPIAIDYIVIHNRPCCRSRLRDITVSILAAPGSDTLVYESELLNPENDLGAGTCDGPEFLEVDVEGDVGGAVEGQIVRLARTPDPDFSGTCPAGNEGEVNVLSVAEVEVFGSLPACPPGAGDTHCQMLTLEGPADGGPGLYTATANGRDDSGETVLYTFTADNGVSPPLVAGPQPTNVARFRLGVGQWAMTVTVDDRLLCEDTAADATCSQELEVVGSGNLALGAVATCSTASGGRCGHLAVDGDFTNTTHTLEDDLEPWVELDLGEEFPLERIVLYNRGDGQVQSRLRDITVSILDAQRARRYESLLLNPENVLGGGGLDGPLALEVNLIEDVGRPVSGRFVRIEREPDFDLSGSGGLGQLPGEDTVLSLGEVEVYGEMTPCPGIGDTHCQALDIEGPAEGGPGVYTATATAEDDSGDSILYTFTADNGLGGFRVVGPQAEPVASFGLTPGFWSISVDADDSLRCHDETVDSQCVEEFLVFADEGDNLTFGAVATCSTASGGRCGHLAVDGDFTNTTHTLEDDLEPWVEIDLLEELSIGRIVLYNRGNGLVQSRLRDITVVISDGEREFLYESELLNPENVLGHGTLEGPALLELDLLEEEGGPVAGQIVRIERTPDLDLSGTGGLGQVPGEDTVLSLGEVEIFLGEAPTFRFRRGDVDAGGILDISDGLFVLNFLFAGGPRPPCLDAADTDDSGRLDLTDGVFFLSWMFLGGPAPPPPGPNDCGLDPTADALVNRDCVFAPCR
jgi:hypothetical protein